MRPRYIIDKGIQKKITAKSRLFNTALDYTAVIYNPKDLSVKIEDSASCAEVDGKKTVAFTFSASQTALLKPGSATIEIYEDDKTIMLHRDNFAFIRKNSLQISSND